MTPKSSTAVHADDLGVAGLRIDLDLADVAAGREREVGRIVERAFLQARLEFARR